jgi:hypothetical protein
MAKGGPGPNSIRAWRIDTPASPSWALEGTAAHDLL